MSLVRIVIVDDNADNADSLATLFTLSNFEVKVAYNGQDGIDLIKEFNPFLMILDISLPDMTGYDVLRLVNRKDIHAMAMSGHGSKEHRDLSLDVGFLKHFVKPLNFDELLSLVNKYVKGD